MDGLYNQLKETVCSMIELPEVQRNKLQEIFLPQIIKKGDFFIMAGQPSNRIGFNCTGLFRYYYTNDNGKEYTKYFCTENRFIVSYSAMLLKSESYYAIEAMEDSQILTASCVDFYHLIHGDSCWQIFVRKLLEEIFIFNERREKAMLLDSAQERYIAFLQDYPNLEERVKQYHIASYLGITPVALSRIRKKRGN